MKKNDMNILVLGAGGREHAIAWKLRQSKHQPKVFVMPGNAGTAKEDAQVVNVATVPNEDLVKWCARQHIDLVVIGPEQPLVDGVADILRQADIATIGPSQLAAKLEGSKVYSKDFMERYKIPTAAAATFIDYATAIDWAQQQTLPLVVKIDRLAAGKGVIIANDMAALERALDTFLRKNIFNHRCPTVLLETCLQGEEVSFICLTDGKTVIPFASSQDHKAAFDGDLGPNTGGMGALSPAPLVTPALAAKIMETIIGPTFAGLAAEGIDYQGFLYFGLMVGANDSLHLLEYNCRLGDPEAQPLLYRLETDFAELLVAVTAQKLSEFTDLAWSNSPALCVVMANGGYPDTYQNGQSIVGLDTVVGAKVFHAGTQINADGLTVTNGGRVLGVTTTAPSLLHAQQLAYTACQSINWKDARYRNDIGDKAIQQIAAQLETQRIKTQRIKARPLAADTGQQSIKLASGMYPNDSGYTAKQQA